MLLSRSSPSSTPPSSRIDYGEIYPSDTPAHVARRCDRLRHCCNIQAPRASARLHFRCDRSGDVGHASFDLDECMYFI